MTKAGIIIIYGWEERDLVGYRNTLTFFAPIKVPRRVKSVGSQLTGLKFEITSTPDMGLWKCAEAEGLGIKRLTVSGSSANQPAAPVHTSIFLLHPTNS